MKTYLMRGDILLMNEEWLIIDMANDCCLLVCLNTTKLIVKSYATKGLMNKIDAGEIDFENNKTDDKIIIFAEHGKSSEINERMKLMANEVLSYRQNLFWLAERQTRAAFIRETAEKFKVSEDTVRLFLRKYLQNGLSLNGIRCKYENCGGKGKTKTYSDKRAGRQGVSQIVRNETVVEQFETIMLRYKNKKTRISMQKMYEDLCSMFYMTEKVVGGELISYPLPPEQRPTYRQLSYYINTHLSDEDAYIAKFGSMDARNNIRAQHSDTIANLPMRTIGMRFEMDETETDFYLTSRYNSGNVIGRAVLYLIVDVFSKMIVGFYCGLENNSWMGAELALDNMVSDKVEICRRAGINIKEEDWPVFNVIPKELLVDNGAEYLSYDFVRFCTENSIAIQYAPPGTGSFKPNVERRFRDFNQWNKGLIPAEIYKDVSDPDHPRKALLTIEDFYKLCLHFILHYNKYPKKGYPQDAEMLLRNILPAPLNIWNYKMESENALRKILNINAYRYSLLSCATASITKEGVKFKKMLYTCDDIGWLEREMIDAKINKSKKVNIRYDKRNLDKIFVEINGKVKKFYLSENHVVNDIYIGCSYEEICLIDAIKNAQLTDINETQLRERILYNREAEAIVKGAKKRKKLKKKPTIRENRKKEQEKLRKESEIIIDLPEDNYQVITENIPNNAVAVESSSTETVLVIAEKEAANMSVEELIMYMNKQEYV